MTEIKMITVLAAAKLLGVSKTSVYAMLRDGRLDGTNLGTRSTRVHRGTIDRLILARGFKADAAK